jgi:hypothetical protein
MAVKGVGSKKRQQYGRAVLTIIRKYCEKHALTMDADAGQTLPHFGLGGRKKRNDAKERAFELFGRGCSIQHVAAAVNRAESTAIKYLCEFIQEEGINDPTCWVDLKTAGAIENAIQNVGSKQLKLIFDHLNGQVDYNQIRILLACLRNG